MGVAEQQLQSGEDVGERVRSAEQLSIGAGGHVDRSEQRDVHLACHPRFAGRTRLVWLVTARAVVDVRAVVVEVRLVLDDRDQPVLLVRRRGGDPGISLPRNQEACASQYSDAGCAPSQTVALSKNGASEDSSITANRANKGGAVQIRHAPLTLLRSTVSGNKAVAGGGGGLALIEELGEPVTATVIDSPRSRATRPRKPEAGSMQ